MTAVIGYVLGVVLNDDDGLAVFLIELSQHLIDAVRMAGIQLGDGLVQDQDLRPQGYGPRQGEKMGLAAGQLPDIVVLPSLQTTERKGLLPSLPVVFHGVIHARIGGVVQHRGADDLIFKILVHIPRPASQRSHVVFPRVQPVHRHLALEIAGDKVGNQPVERLAESGFPAAVVADNG